MAYKDIRVRRARDLERYHRRTEARRPAGLCLNCGRTEPEPERTLCAPCAGEAQRRRPRPVRQAARRGKTEA